MNIRSHFLAVVGVFAFAIFALKGCVGGYASVTFASGSQKPGSIAIADFNGDSKFDIAVSDFNSNSIAVFLNKGDGTFNTPIISPVQITAVGLDAIAVVDLNGDGLPDIVVSNSQTNQITIILSHK